MSRASLPSVPSAIAWVVRTSLRFRPSSSNLTTSPGRYVFDLAFDGVIKAAAVAHPSLLKIPEDIEKYSQTNVPLLVESCETDMMFPPDLQAKMDAILGDGKFAPGYRRDYWPGCTHGFANRGDGSIPAVKAGKEGAFKAVVEWMATHL